MLYMEGVFGRLICYVGIFYDEFVGKNILILCIIDDIMVKKIFLYVKIDWFSVIYLYIYFYFKRYEIY